MTGLPGFGLHITIPGMASRKWYAGKDGIQRWADNDQPMAIDPRAVADRLVADYAELETSEGILALQSDNSDIDVSESAHYPGETK